MKVKDTASKLRVTTFNYDNYGQLRSSCTTVNYGNTVVRDEAICTKMCGNKYYSHSLREDND